MGNEIRAKYSADISQLEIANDKLTAQNEKMARQIATMTAKASGFNKTYGNSWNAVKARVEEYTRAVKGATNLRDWYGAIEKLQGAQKEFEQINAAVQQVTAGQKEAVVVATNMKNSYNDLESQLRDVREQMKQVAATSDDFKKLALEEAKVKSGLEAINNEVQRIQLEAKGNQSIRTIDQLAKRITDLRTQYRLMADSDPSKAGVAAKIEKMQVAYDRLSASTKKATAVLAKNSETSRVAADSIKGLDQQIEHMTKRASSLSATSKEFEVLTAQIRRLTSARQKLSAIFKPVDNKPEETKAPVNLGSLEAKTMQRDYLQNIARGLDGSKFEAATAKIRELNAEIQKMETSFRKAEETIVIDPVVLNSVDGLTQRIAHLQEMMNKVDNTRAILGRDPGSLELKPVGTTAAANSEYLKMAETLVRLKKELKSLKDLQNIPVETVVTARKSYDALREAIERTRKARDGAVKGSAEFNALEDKLQKLEAGYKRLTASANANSSATKKQADVVRVAGDSMAGLQKQVDFLQDKLEKTSKGSEFDRLSSILAKLQARLKSMQADAGKASAAMSKGATAAAGSFTRLDYELKKAKKDLEGMTLGTKEFIAQQMKVARIQEHWDKLDKTINKTEKAQKQSAGVVGTMIGQAKSLVATYVGIHQVMTQITAEWEKQRAFQLDAANKGANNQGEAVKQAPNIGVENLPGVMKWARENQVDLLSKQNDIIALIGAAISGGAPNVDAAKKVTAAALKINVGDRQLAEEMLQGGMTVARLNNSDNYEAAFGQLRSSSKVSQAVNESEFIGNVLGKMAALTRGRKNLDGMSTERALEYISAASRIQADRTGDTSATNMQAIFQRMDEFAPELKKTLKDKTVATATPEAVAAFKAARSFDEKLDLLRRNKGLGDQFIDRQRTGGPKELAFALVQNNQAVSKIMQESADAVLPFQNAGKVFKEATEKVRDAVPALIAQRKMQAGSEKAATDDRTVALATARATYDAIWNTDAAGNPPKNLSGWDMGKRIVAGAEIYGAAGDRQFGVGKGGPRTEVEAMMKAVQMLIREETGAAALADLKSKLDVLQDISRTLQSIDAKTNGERFFGEQQRQMMPPIGWKPRVLAPAAAAAAAATAKSR